MWNEYLSISNDKNDMIKFTQWFARYHNGFTFSSTVFVHLFFFVEHAVNEKYLLNHDTYVQIAAIVNWNVIKIIKYIQNQC